MVEVGWGGPEPTINSGKFDDSANILHDIPLYERVKNAVQHWQNIGSNNIVIKWINEGVYIKPDS